MSRKDGFTAAGGRWVGTAEVYSGDGRFLGNAADNRHVQVDAGENRVKIDLSFVGPFKFAGHYFIEDHKEFRLYQGPANTGYAETLASNLIDANGYWPITGLSQRFFLMILDGEDKQMSLGLMSRGDQLIYVVIGEYNRITEDAQSSVPSLINGTEYDLAQDPTAGRGEIYLHRPGVWQGELFTLDGKLEELESTQYKETVERNDKLIKVTMEGSHFAPNPETAELKTNDLQAWSNPGNLVGSYNLSGGRALSGNFHYLNEHLRVWRREVVDSEGTLKVVLNTWYLGGERVGVQFGTLKFKSA